MTVLVPIRPYDRAVCIEAGQGEHGDEMAEGPAGISAAYEKGDAVPKQELRERCEGLFVQLCRDDEREAAVKARVLQLCAMSPRIP